MKKILLFLPLVLIIQFVDAQTSQKKFNPMYVEAQRWSRIPGTYSWQMYKTRVIDSLINYTTKTDSQNLYGSSSALKTEATGFFHVKKINDRWWVIDPEGFCNIQRAINDFKRGKSERNINAYDAKYKSDLDWAEKSANEFKDIGINGTGAWSDDEMVRYYNQVSDKHKLSYSVNLNLMARFISQHKRISDHDGIEETSLLSFVFNPAFERFCDSVAMELLYPYSDDPNLFGYFSDNELPFGQQNLTDFLNHTIDDHAKNAAQNWLREKGISREQLTDRTKDEFAGFLAEKYFRIVSSAIRKADKNHMYLGSRVHSQVKFTPEVMMAAGRYCDIVSINYYTVWTPDSNHLSDWAKWTNRPFIITEFYTKGMDSGLPNITGAGWNVRTQNDRGYAYQDFCLALLESKNCIGWHYFKYQDNDPTAPNPGRSNIDSNKGIVNNDYQFYSELTNTMKQLNKQIYSLINYFDN